MIFHKSKVSENLSPTTSLDVRNEIAKGNHHFQQLFLRFLEGLIIIFAKASSTSSFFFGGAESVFTYKLYLKNSMVILKLT